VSYCVRMTLPGGTTGYVRIAGKRPKPCIVCGQPSTRACDWKIAKRPPSVKPVEMPIHPGELLLEYLEVHDMTQRDLARAARS
jgi:hypothetical protein